MSNRLPLLIMLGTACLAPAAFAASPKAAPTDASAYASAIDNPWFPMQPGTTLVYKGTLDDRRADREFEVTTKTKVIAGIICIVAEDRVNLGGKPSEKTIAYYAQDKDGNVWYFGEESQELDKQGKVIKSEGWLAGTDGATPNLLMYAHPEVGDRFEHAYTGGITEVLKLAAPVDVPYGSFKDALQIKDWNPAEVDVLSHKFYLKGVGEARDTDVKGQSEEIELVKVQ